MALFRNLILTAVLVGLIAGLLSAALQEFLTTPLVIQAEQIESRLPAPAATAPAHDDGHHHGPGWAPADGLERQVFTVLASLVGTIGFALIMLVAAELTGGLRNWRHGLAWGVAGFFIFVLAPSLGLPPELPAMPAADLVARQAWWLATAAATAVGIALLVFTESLVLAVFAVIVLVAPHLIGAPHPDDLTSPIPAALHQLFVVRVTMVNFIFWIVLGSLAGAFAPRFLARDELPAATARVN